MERRRQVGISVVKDWIPKDYVVILVTQELFQYQVSKTVYECVHSRLG